MTSAEPEQTLTGRDQELSRMYSLVADLAFGRGGAVLVEGEAGIGKSALLGAAAAAADRRGCQVFWSAGDPLGTAFPLAPLLDAFAIRESASDPARAEVARALRGGYAGPGGGAATAAAEALLALVDEVCATVPAMLVIDDLQWADESTVMVCHRLIRTAPQRALLIVGAMRPLPRRDDLKTLRRTVGKTSVLRLQSLAEDATDALVAELTGAEPGGELRKLAADAAGNPLYLTGRHDQPTP
jgi:predicted ATPase